MSYFWVRADADWHGPFESGREAVGYCIEHDSAFDIWEVLSDLYPSYTRAYPWLIITNEAEEILMEDDFPAGSWDIEDYPR